MAILFCSTALALIATGSQQLLDYRQGVGAIESRMGEIEHVYLDSVGASLWTMDEQQSRKQIEGIARLPDIESVELRGPAGKFLMRAWGKRSAENLIRREIPIQFSEDGTSHNKVSLSTLEVTTSLDNLYRDLQDKALLILVRLTTKTTIVAFFVLFIFRRMISRHLSAIAAYARRLDLNKLGERLVLRRHKRKSDELDVVVAEGVEDAQQVDLLRAYGCDQMQGYYFSAPLTSEAFVDVLYSGVTLGMAAVA